MCMNKEFVVEEIDPFQTINRFIREIYPEGYAAFPQYGDSSRTKTERFTTVPFMMMNGSMQWKVPIKIATMGEFLTTFEMDSNDTVIVEKVAYAIGDEINCKDLLNVFWGFYRECIRKWEPKGRYREFRYLKHFILSKGNNQYCITLTISAIQCLSPAKKVNWQSGMRKKKWQRSRNIKTVHQSEFFLTK